MSEQLTLSAETRDRAGKGASRHLRREGRVPAVVYGNNEEALSIHLEEKALVKALSSGHFMNSVVMIDAGAAPVRTLPKDVQFHPVTDRPLHVDFLRISEHAKVHVDVPIHFVDEDKSRGIKRGGVLNQVRHELELICDAAEIPEEIVVSLAGIISGLVVAGGLAAGRRLDAWAGVFLITTLATSVTGFGFPTDTLLPSHIVGGISILVLAATIAAHVKGWRVVYASGVVAATYLNSFVLVVQLFRRVPDLSALAPTQSEPAFALAQLVVLAAFVWLGVAANAGMRSAVAGR